MIKYLKFALVFLLEVIKTNVVKILFLIGTIVFFFNAGNVPNSVDSYNVVGQVKIDNNYIYICRTVSEAQIKYENIWDSKEMPVKDGKIYISSYSNANVLLWIGFGVCLIFVVIATLIGMNDDDVGWELEDAWKSAFETLIYCEEENGIYYYFALGRLIEKRDRQAPRNYGICTELRISGFRELYRCPKYQTKTQRRETLLNKIGIN